MMFKHLFSLLLVLLCGLSAAAQTTEKKIYQEPLWYASIGSSAFDMTSSALIIDGIRFKEANPIMRDENGKVHWPRAFAYTAFYHILEYRTYKKSRKWGIVFMVANVLVRGGLGGTRNMVLYYKHRL